MRLLFVLLGNILRADADIESAPTVRDYPSKSAALSGVAPVGQTFCIRSMMGW